MAGTHITYHASHIALLVIRQGNFFGPEKITRKSARSASDRQRRDSLRCLLSSSQSDDSYGVNAPPVCTTMLRKKLNVMFNVTRYVYEKQSKTAYCIMLCRKKDILIFTLPFHPSHAAEAQKKYVCIYSIFP